MKMRLVFGCSNAREQECTLCLGEGSSEAADGDVFPDSQWDGVSGS